MTSTQLSGSVQVVAQGLLEESSTQQHGLGELVHSSDGRAFRYAKAGVSALVAGTLQQSPAEDTGDQNIAATAAAIGATSVTTAAMTVTANQYSGGLMVVTSGTGKGLQYRIAGHAAFTSAAATFTLSDAIKVALDTTSTLDFVANPLNGVVINPVTQTSAPVGVAVTALTAAYFGWLQVAGVATCLADGATVVGAGVDAASGSVAGAIEDGTLGATPPVGIAQSGIADTEYGPVKLLLL